MSPEDQLLFLEDNAFQGPLVGIPVSRSVPDRDGKALRPLLNCEDSAGQGCNFDWLTSAGVSRLRALAWGKRTGKCFARAYE